MHLRKGGNIPVKVRARVSIKIRNKLITKINDSQNKVLVWIKNIMVCVWECMGKV